MQTSLQLHARFLIHRRERAEAAMLRIHAINDSDDPTLLGPAVKRDELEFQVEVLQEDYRRATLVHKRFVDNRALVSLKDVRIEYEKVLARSIVEHEDLRKALFDMRARVLFLTYRNLGRLHEDEGRNADALEYYIQASVHDPEDGTTWSKVGRLALLTGRWRLARAAYEQGISVAPRHPMLRQGLLNVLRVLDDVVALKAAESLLSIEAGDGDPEETPEEQLYTVPVMFRERPMANPELAPFKARRRLDVAAMRRAAEQSRGKRRSLVLDHATFVGLGQLLIRTFMELERSTSDIAQARVTVRTQSVSTDLQLFSAKGRPSSMLSAADVPSSDGDARSPSPEPDEPASSSNGATRKRRAPVDFASMSRKSSRVQAKSSDEERRRRLAEVQEDVRPLLEWFLGLAGTSEGQDEAEVIPLIHCFRRAIASPELLVDEANGPVSAAARDSSSSAASTGALPRRNPVAFKDLQRRKERAGFAELPDGGVDDTAVNEFLQSMAGRYSILDLMSSLLTHLTGDYGNHFWGSSPTLYGVVMTLHRIVDGSLRARIDRLVFELLENVDMGEQERAPLLREAHALFNHCLVLYEIALCGTTVVDARHLEAALVALMAAIPITDAERVRFFWLNARHCEVAGDRKGSLSSIALCRVILPRLTERVAFANCPDIDVLTLENVDLTSVVDGAPLSLPDLELVAQIDLRTCARHLQEILERPTVENMLGILRALDGVFAKLAAASNASFSELVEMLSADGDERDQFLHNVLSIAVMSYETARLASASTAPPKGPRAGGARAPPPSSDKASGAPGLPVLLHASSRIRSHPVIQLLASASSQCRSILCNAWLVLHRLCATIGSFGGLSGDPPGFVSVPLEECAPSVRLLALAHGVLGPAGACTFDGGGLLAYSWGVIDAAIREATGEETRVALIDARRQMVVCLYGLLETPLAELDESDMKSVSRHSCECHRKLDEAAAADVFKRLFQGLSHDADLNMIDSLILQHVQRQTPVPEQLVLTAATWKKWLFDERIEAGALAKPLTPPGVVGVDEMPQVLQDLFFVRAWDLKTYKEISSELFDHLLCDVVLNPDRAASWMTIAEYSYVYSSQRLHGADQASELTDEFSTVVDHLILGLRAFQHAASQFPEACAAQENFWAQYGVLVHLLASNPIWAYVCQAEKPALSQVHRNDMLHYALAVYKRAMGAGEVGHEVLLSACRLTEKLNRETPQVFIDMYAEHLNDVRIGKEIRTRLILSLARLCCAEPPQLELVRETYVLHIDPDAVPDEPIAEVILRRLTQMMPSGVKEARDAHRLPYRSAMLLMHLGRWAEAQERLLVIMLPRRGNVGPTMRAINSWDAYGKYLCYSEKYTRLLLGLLQHNGDIARLAECVARLSRKPLDILNVGPLRALAVKRYVMALRTTLLADTQPVDLPLLPADVVLHHRSTDSALAQYYEALTCLAREYTEGDEEVGDALKALYFALCARLPATQDGPRLEGVTPLQAALEVGRANPKPGRRATGAMSEPIISEAPASDAPAAPDQTDAPAAADQQDAASAPDQAEEQGATGISDAPASLPEPLATQLDADMLS